MPHFRIALVAGACLFPLHLAYANCFTVPDYRTGLDRIICDQSGQSQIQPQMDWTRMLQQAPPPTTLLGPQQRMDLEESALRRQILLEQLRQLQNR